MSLLQALNLKPTPRLATGPAGAMPPPLAAVAGSAPPPVPAPRAAKPRGAEDPPIVHPDQKRLRAELALELEKARATFRKLDAYEEPLEKRIAAAQGDAKKQLLAAKAEIVKKKAEAEKAMHEAHADLEALDAPVRHEELVKILARRGARGNRATELSYEQAGLKTPTARNHDTTTTTSSYTDGKAVVEKVRDARKLGAGGSTTTHVRETEVRDDKLAVKVADEKTTKLSTTGKYTSETKRSVEVETADGRKAGASRTDATEIDRKGAKREHTTKVTNLDGSSHSTTRTNAVERDEGKLVASTGTSTTATDASGTATKRDSKVSGGLVAGKDGYGATAGVEKGKTVTSKDGRQVGVVGGLHANVLCNVGKPKGDPPVYPVTVTVSFGGSVAVSAGRGKQEGSTKSLDVSVKASEERSMTVTHMLPAAELPGYVQALHDASTKGGKVAATHREFAIIAAGVNQGWEAARALWKGRAIDKATADGLTHAGDSIEKSETSGRGAGVKAKVGWVGGGVSDSDTDRHSTKVTRNAKGALDVEGKGGHTHERSRSGSMDSGAVGLEIGRAHTEKTSFGYAITIDPKDDPDGKILAHLALCRTETDYQLFMAVHHGRITVTGITHGHGDADATSIGVSVAGLKLGLGTHQGIDVETTKDAKGKVTHQKVEGHAGAGGSLGPLADSVDEDAVAEVDEKGHAELTLTRTTKDNHNRRARARKIEQLKQKVGLAKPEDGGKGALETASGGDDDNTVEDVSGLKLTHGELKKLGKKFLGSRSVWVGNWRRADEKKDWIRCGEAIARGKGAAGVVAEELARFIGGDRVERMNTVEHFIRGGWGVIKMGKAFEFPDAIRSAQADYDTVMEDGLPKKLDTLAAKDAKAAIEECKRLQSLTAAVMAKVSACDDFSSPGTKGEMLHHLQVRRDMLTSAIKGYAGQPVEDPERLRARANEWMKLCGDYSVQQARLLADLHDLLDGDRHFLARDLGDAKKLLHQLDDLHNRWNPYYAELKGVMKKLGNPSFEMPNMKPDAAKLKFYEDAAG